MLQEHAVRKYFQEGLDRGFNKEYLRQNLLRHGYDASVIALVYHSLNSSQSEVPSSLSSTSVPTSVPLSISSSSFFSKPTSSTAHPFPQPLIPQRPQSPFPSPSRLVLYSIIVIFVLLGGYALTTSWYTPSPTGFAVVNQEQALEEISALDQQIEEKHSALQQQLGELQQKDLTIEEKNKIIEEQISELEKLHQSISEERDKIRALLLDLFNTIVDKPSKIEEWQSGESMEE